MFDSLKKRFKRLENGVSSLPVIAARHPIGFLVVLLTLVFAIFAVILWQSTYSEKTIVGEISAFTEPRRIVVGINDKEPITVRVPDTAAIRKDKAASRFSSLEVGDTVRVRYYTRAVMGPQAIYVRASSPFWSGRIIGVDLDKNTVTIKSGETKTFEINAQAVILVDGSLAGISDLKRGQTAKAEYHNPRNPRLYLLTVENKKQP